MQIFHGWFQLNTDYSQSRQHPVIAFSFGGEKMEFSQLFRSRIRIFRSPDIAKYFFSPEQKAGTSTGMIRWKIAPHSFSVFSRLEVQGLRLLDNDNILYREKVYCVQSGIYRRMQYTWYSILSAVHFWHCHLFFGVWRFESWDLESKGHVQIDHWEAIPGKIIY